MIEQAAAVGRCLHLGFLKSFLTSSVLIVMLSGLVLLIVGAIIQYEMSGELTAILSEVCSC